MSEPVTSRLALRVQPNASRSEIIAWYGTALRLWVAAPPSRGRANAAVTALLADVLKIPRSSVNIIRGRGSRDKVAEVQGMDNAELHRRLQNLLNTDGSATTISRN